MATAVHTYRVDPKKADAFKRQSNISLLVPYLFPIGLVVYQLVRTGYDYRFIILSAGVTVLAVALLIMSIIRSNKRIDTMKLEVSDTAVTLTESGKPKQVSIANITSIETHVKGIELKTQPKSRNAFVVYNEFEKFDQIKKLIEAKVAKNKR
ncbi:hypothetical protein [Mucilaginibacter agri]|uniref:Uncharacterized protein n=1 Tax=Mucilaginibacter agri TaxID=2695265 RepID=A0A966DTB1_9SPHI|nr:hypothetical protein [Mucilaginibacter agri]NCD70480.1 hypothetical protein [Mucilaginibacter agri]